jgi:uncharacterized repeat protein (TIGR01451 family)
MTDAGSTAAEKPGSRTRRGIGLAAAAALVGAGLAIVPALRADAEQASFSTVGTHSFVVPAGVTAITVDAYGAQGSDSAIGSPRRPRGGRGGRATATIAVTPGETLTVVVGGAGSASGSGGASGGFNGGGDTGGQESGSGGGASDVRQGGMTRAHRVVVAGGGGGAGYELPADGGSGGGASGGNAGSNFGAAGAGGGQTGGGAGGPHSGGLSGAAGEAGDTDGLGEGGDGGVAGTFGGGGGGGGGLHGGGGGGASTGGGGGGGGGGSGYTPDGTGLSNGVRTGNGLVTLTYELPPAVDLALSKSSSAESALLGEEFDYTLTVTNKGPGVATNVVVTDTLPAVVTLVDGALPCVFSSIAEGDSASCVVTVRAVTAGSAVNFAWVASDNPDPETGDNSDAVETTIIAPGYRPDAEIALGAGAPSGAGVINTDGAGQSLTAPLRLFQTASFTVRVRNTGNVDDGYLVAGPGGNWGFQVRYFDGPTEVTAAVLAGTHATGALEPGAADELTVRVRVTPLALLAPRIELPVRFSSAADLGAVDVVLARARFRLF